MAPKLALPIADEVTAKGPASSGGITDPSGNPITPDPATVTFRAQTYPGDPSTLRTLPLSTRLAPGSLTTRGILMRLVQVSATIANDNGVTEQILGGVYPNPGSPLPNIAPVSIFLETNVVNYNKDAPDGTATGHLTPDTPFPGFGPNLAVLDNLAIEAVCYIQLGQGVYRMGVNSDDGFRVTAGLSVEDTNNAIILGEFNGGRGAADTTFDFAVAQDGLYPFRLAYEEGQGGVNVEWWVQDLDNPAVYYAINGGVVAGGFPGGSPNSFVPPCLPKALSIQHSGGNVIASWPLADGGNLFQLQQATVLASPPSATVWQNVNVIPQTVGPNKSVLLPATGPARYLRLIRPAPCN